MATGNEHWLRALLLATVAIAACDEEPVETAATSRPDPNSDGPRSEAQAAVEERLKPPDLGAAMQPRAEPAPLALPPLDPKRVAEAEKKLEVIERVADPAARKQRVAALFAELEASRVPDEVGDVLATYEAAMNPSLREVELLELVSKQPALTRFWQSACKPAGKVLFEHLAETQDYAQGAKLLFDKCRLRERGLVDRDALRASPGEVSFAHALWLALGGESAHPIETKLLVAYLTTGPDLSAPVAP